MSLAFVPVNRAWFEEISSGRCRVELRAATPHWLRWLLPAKRVVFVNGYRPTSPRLCFEILEVDVVPASTLSPDVLRAHGFERSQDVIRIVLGDVVDQPWK